jgi:hypothetical protein
MDAPSSKAQLLLSTTTLFLTFKYNACAAPTLPKIPKAVEHEAHPHLQ